MDISEDLTLSLILIISGLLCYLKLKSFRRPGKLPPGPTPLPVLGNILQICQGGLSSTLLKMKEKYGDVFTVYMGSRPFVVFCGYNAVKEVYVDRGEDFLARGDASNFDTDCTDKGLALMSHVDRWKELRRFSQFTMRDLGMGKKSMEERVQEEAQYLVEEIRKSNKSYFNPQLLLSKASGNIMFSIIFGNRHDYEDVEIQSVLQCISETLLLMSSRWGQVFAMFPKIMPFLPGKHQKLLSNMNKLVMYTKKRVENNWKTLDPDNPKSYVDAFIIKMEKEKSNPHTEYNLDNLVYSTFQLIAAGIEPISLTFVYSLLLLMKYPDVVKKVCKEIDHVIGQHRCPSLQDKNQMPYTEAVIHELQRYIDQAPLGVIRKTSKDVELRGYIIPKDTNIVPMLTSVLKDSTYFPYPNEFNPNNFLDENGLFIKSDAFIPFAAGKRKCMGEGLVRMQMFIFLVTILQNFDLKPELPWETLDISPAISGLANISKPYKMSFIPR